MSSRGADSPDPRESDRECDLCRLRLRWRRPWRWYQLILIVLPGAVLLLLPRKWYRAPGMAGLRFAAVLPAGVLLAELALFLALGGGRLLLRRWGICPWCGDFRLGDADYRLLVRIERVFDPLGWYLLVPGAFLYLLSIFRPAYAWLAPTLVLAGFGARLFASIRPKGRPPPWEPRWTRRTGDRIADSGSE